MEPMSRSMESSVGLAAQNQLDERSEFSRPIRGIGGDERAQGAAGQVSEREGAATAGGTWLLASHAPDRRRRLHRFRERSRVLVSDRAGLRGLHPPSWQA